jgi:hypothetical protein
MIRAGSDSRGFVLMSRTIAVFDLEFTAWKWAQHWRARLRPAA